MAEGKKSFLLYCDLIHTVNLLSDEHAGKLLKHVLAYVNDQNPQSDDPILNISFEPIKQALKRDLKKYEGKRDQNRENALKRWNAIASDRMQMDAKHADSDIVIGNVKDKKGIEERKSEFYKLLSTYIQMYDKSIIREFYDYWTEHGTKDKKMKFEKEKSFDPEKRLATWKRNQSKFGNNTNANTTNPLARYGL